MQLQMVLVAAVQGVGTLHVRGAYTQGVYAIPPQGVLVHPYDVDSIIQQQKTFCCRGGEEARVIYPFFVGKATAGQVAYVEVSDPEQDRASTMSAAAAEAATIVKGRNKKPAPPASEPGEAAGAEGEPKHGGRELPPGG